MPTAIGNNNQNFRFNFLFFRRFYRICKFLFPELFSLTAILFAFLLVLSLFEQYLIYNVGIISSKYYKVLGDKDLHGFWMATISSVLFIMAEAFVKSTSTYTSNILQVSWRQLLTRAIHRQYFKRINYYRFNVLDDQLDNPDQRLTQDVNRMCQVFSEISATIIISPFTIAYYTYQASTSTGYLGPVGVLIFFIIGTAVNKFLMSPIVALVANQERQEGNFRFKHMQIRSNAESLAFLNGGNVELIRTNAKLEELIVAQQRLFNHQYPLNMSINMFDYLGAILSYLILAVPIFAGKYDSLTPAELSELISKNAFVCIYLINCFSKLVDLSTKVTEMAGSAHRIAEMLEVLARTDDGDDKKSNMEVVHWAQTSSRLEGETTLGFVFKDVSYSYPGTRSDLVTDLNLSFTTEHSILITGKSSSGKTSLLRVMANIWQPRQGYVETHISRSPKDIMYLPQKPYFTDGSLRQQIVYPLRVDAVDHQKVLEEDSMKIIEYLQLVQLDGLLDRENGLDSTSHRSWYDVLSPGEMQRLSFVRLFYHQPKMAVLDEATSAVSIDVEDILYRECIRLKIAMVSAGHRQSLQQYHQMQLDLNGNGKWSLAKITP